MYRNSLYRTLYTLLDFNTIHHSYFKKKRQKKPKPEIRSLIRWGIAKRDLQSHHKYMAEPEAEINRSSSKLEQGISGKKNKKRVRW
uniref:Uncharacterized protein n=1 Tax=Nelumbo nucifera TaxID=4432 RepID=A0A822ZZA2_NELNU|nr:TPA_asm: hypothetical protein HUJ06_018376 [Nelumbo nucifera]